jgi:hypothetical protein
MEEIFEIRILKDSGFNDIDYFGSTSVLPQLKKFIVEPVVKQEIDETGNVTKLYSARKKLNGGILGFIRIVTYTTYIVFTFYVSNDENKNAFSKFIDSTIADLEFSGFSVHGSRNLIEEPIDVRNEDDYDLPITAAAIQRWKDIYDVCVKMRNEDNDSDGLDSLEVFIPTLADYRDRIIEKLRIRRCEKTISKIIRAGDAGKLI